MRGKISKKGSKFLKEGRFKDLLRAIQKKKEGIFKSDSKTYRYRVIGETQVKENEVNNWNPPEESPKDKRSYDCCSVDVLVKFKHPTLGAKYSIGNTDYDGDEIIWDLHSRWAKKCIRIIGWKYIDDNC